tara:strand:+ start:392 stop:883 length:492 start_codon:yes stop_codon:yes gene_type:complete
LAEIIVINSKNINSFRKFIKKNYQDFKDFESIGWSVEQIYKHLEKKTNSSYGLIENDNLIGFVIGNLIKFDNFSEYEIYIIYIDTQYRKLGYGTDLISIIADFPYNLSLRKITLEVSEKNIKAVNFYKKNKFNLIGVRKNYYVIKNKKKENALIFEKLIYDYY